MGSKFQPCGDPGCCMCNFFFAKDATCFANTEAVPVKPPDAPAPLTYTSDRPTVPREWYWMRHAGEKRGSPVYVADLRALDIPYYADCMWAGPIPQPGENPGDSRP